MAFVVVYDAAVLYPAALRDLLIRVARTGLVRAHWTDAILDECFRSILANRADLRAGTLKRTRDLMIAAVPDCLITGYEPLISGLTLPDPDDRHVLAAAIRAGAQLIVTWNWHRTGWRLAIPTRFSSTSSTSRRAQSQR